MPRWTLCVYKRHGRPCRGIWSRRLERDRSVRTPSRAKDGRRECVSEKERKTERRREKTSVIRNCSCAYRANVMWFENVQCLSIICRLSRNLFVVQIVGKRYDPMYVHRYTRILHVFFVVYHHVWYVKTGPPVNGRWCVVYEVYFIWNYFRR